MGFEYVGVEEAIGREGLRMVVVGGVPSPWGEAAKGLFHLKNLDWAGVRLVHDSDALLQWAGERTGPVAATIDLTRTGEPIDRRLYGYFIDVQTEFYIGDGGTWNVGLPGNGRELFLNLNLDPAQLVGADGRFIVNVIRIPQ